VKDTILVKSYIEFRVVLAVFQSRSKGQPFPFLEATAYSILRTQEEGRRASLAMVYSPLFNKHLLVLHVLGFRFFFFWKWLGLRKGRIESHFMLSGKGTFCP
jgi:hypothetical protein